MEAVPKHIDKTQFSKIINACGIKFPANLSSKYLKDFKDYLLNLEKYPNIPKDFKEQNNKLLLLNAQFQKDTFQDWPEPLRTLVTENNYDLLNYQVQLNYDDMNMQEILREVLPADIIVPAGFETVGNIAHLNLRSSQLPYKYIIGQALIDKSQKIRTVVNKTEKLNNVFRTPELEVIAGENNLETELKEGGCIFKLNFEKVYWNSKLQAERDRLLNTFKSGETLCDMFCGIGPLSVRAAKKGVYVLANDLNPHCYEYLKINTKLNKIDKMIECFNMDAREFLKEAILERDNPIRFDHIYMNLPVDAVEFLDVFTGLFRNAPKDVWNPDNLPFIHVYGFDTGKTPEEVRKNLVTRASKAFGEDLNPDAITDIHPIKDISSDKKMYCLSFKLPKEIAYAESQTEETIEKKVKTA